MNIKLLFFVILIFSIELVLVSNISNAQFWVTGNVTNASDGESANGYSVVLWAEDSGRSDNLTDVIGPTGGCGADNCYMIDCDLLSSPCTQGDNIFVEVIENASNYTSETTNKTISSTDWSNGFMEMDNLQLIHDTPPNITIIFPPNASTQYGTIMINVSVINTSFQTANVSYAINNGTHNLTKDGNQGWSPIYNSSATYYNDTLDTTVFGDGTYVLYVKANNTKGKENVSSVNFTIIYIDLFINSGNITFSNSTPAESTQISINATVFNFGDSNATDVIVQFFENNYTLGNQIGDNVTINVSGNSNTTTGVNWTVQMGTHNFFVVIDPNISLNGSINETNESNNVANNSINVSSWHIFYGNITGNLSLMDANNYSLLAWSVSNTSGSNVFVADYDSSIDFTSLLALGMNISGNYRSNDFEELDVVLNTTNYPDSINSTYTSGGAPKNNMSIIIFGVNITNIPWVNSTNSTNFKTGILWDYSDDNGDGEFDQTDSEDVLFVTQANYLIPGKYGTYDYEIRVPANLRRQHLTDTSSVSFYAEIK